MQPRTLRMLQISLQDSTLETTWCAIVSPSQKADSLTDQVTAAPTAAFHWHPQSRKWPMPDECRSHCQSRAQGCQHSTSGNSIIGVHGQQAFKLLTLAIQLQQVHLHLLPLDIPLRMPSHCSHRSSTCKISACLDDLASSPCRSGWWVAAGATPS